MASNDLAAEKVLIGTRIDGGTLELVEILGVGGYGVVYRAVDTRRPSQSYAVKCLMHNQHQPSMRRQHHIREITLHQLSSVHPGVVTLHRVIEDAHYTYIIMDYAPDHDLFTQILNNSRYLGKDDLIKAVFLQLIDAVDYCHSLGIYHRDLKPENVLCFDSGTRVAITDFGLATTEKVSGEMRTGSIYHMSPECQGDEFSTGRYSPMFNDVWSLGIILLNLATGRNPWKTATLADETFCEYLRNPFTFFPTVLPISHDLNEILIRVLHVDWTERMTLSELREEIEDIETFYNPDVTFDGSQARCPWEMVQTSQEWVDPANPDGLLKPYWSDDSQLECEAPDPNSPESYKDHALRSFYEDVEDDDLSVAVDLRSGSSSSSSSSSSPPLTPDDAEASFIDPCQFGCVLMNDGGARRNSCGKASSSVSSSSGSSFRGKDPVLRELSPFFCNSPSSSSMTSLMSSTDCDGDSGVSSRVSSFKSRIGDGDFWSKTHRDSSAWAGEASVTTTAAPLTGTGHRWKERKGMNLNPMKLLARSQWGHLSMHQQWDAAAPYAPKPSQKMHQRSRCAADAHKVLRDLQADDDNRRRKALGLGPGKYWFSPSRLFF